MNIINLDFEEPLYIHIKGDLVQIFAFKTQEPGNIKFGIEAPRTLQVHREEIYHIIQQKKELIDATPS